MLQNSGDDYKLIAWRQQGCMQGRSGSLRMLMLTQTEMLGCILYFIVGRLLLKVEDSPKARHLLLELDARALVQSHRRVFIGAIISHFIIIKAITEEWKRRIKEYSNDQKCPSSMGYSLRPPFSSFFKNSPRFFSIIAYSLKLLTASLVTGLMIPSRYSLANIFPVNIMASLCLS